MAIIHLYLLVSMVAVLWLDTTRFRIPNWLVGGLLAAYPVAVFLLPNPVDWQGGLVGMGIVFAVGYAVFAMNWMGGGDIKLLSALALWVGLAHLLEFVFLVALLGGVYALLVWGVRKVLVAPKIAIKLGHKKLPRLLQEGEPIAYGVAIALGFLLMMAQGKIGVM